MSTKSWVIGGLFIAAAITLSRQKAAAEEKLQLLVERGSPRSVVGVELHLELEVPDVRQDRNVRFTPEK